MLHYENLHDLLARLLLKVYMVKRKEFRRYEAPNLNCLVDAVEHKMFNSNNHQFHLVSTHANLIFFAILLT